MIATKQKRTAGAAGDSGWESARARRGAAVGFAAALACSLSGCGADYASSDPVFPGDFQARHPIALAFAPTSLEVFPVGGALDSRTIANLRAFAERYRELGSGQILILTPSRQGSEARAVNQILQDPRRGGIGPQGQRRLICALRARERATDPRGLRKSQGRGQNALRIMAGRSRLWFVARRMEERALRQFRLCDAIRHGGPGRRSP